MTLVEAAERLRLDVATLQALEAGRFHTLGAAVFVRGHLRHYAELLGLPVDEIEAAYAASSARLAPQPDLRRTTTLPGNSASRGLSLPPRAALIGAIVLVLVALVWWAMRVPPGRRHAANPAVASPSSSLAPTPQTANGVVAGPEPSADAAAASKNPAATSKDAASKDSSPTPRDAAAPKETATPKAASGQVRLAIRFNQDSWIEVYDARGSTLFHDFGGAGSERRVTGAAPLRVLLGNPDGVSVELNGHPVALRPAAESGRPQRFVLDSAGGMSDVPTPQSQRAPSTSSTPP
jgi:cytoskeleton protein RodZ